MLNLLSFKYRIKRRILPMTVGCVLFAGVGWVTPRLYSQFAPRTTQAQVITKDRVQDAVLGITEEETDNASASADRSH